MILKIEPQHKNMENKGIIMQKKIVLIVLSTLGNLQAAELTLQLPTVVVPGLGSDLLTVEELSLVQRSQQHEQSIAEKHEQSIAEMRVAFSQLVTAGTTFVKTLDPDTVKKGGTIAAGVIGAAVITNQVAQTPILRELMAVVGFCKTYYWVSSECEKLGLTSNAIINSTGRCAPVAKCAVNLGVLAAVCSCADKVGLDMQNVYVGLGVFVSSAAICNRFAS